MTWLIWALLAGMMYFFVVPGLGGAAA